MTSYFVISYYYLLLLRSFMSIVFTWWKYIQLCATAHFSPTLLSDITVVLEIGLGGSVYTREISKCYKSGLPLLSLSKVNCSA